MVPTHSMNRRTALRTPLSSHLASQACLKTLLEQAVRAHKANQAPVAEIGGFCLSRR